MQRHDVNDYRVIGCWIGDYVKHCEALWDFAEILTVPARRFPLCIPFVESLSNCLNGALQEFDQRLMRLEEALENERLRTYYLPNDVFFDGDTLRCLTFERGKALKRTTFDII